MMESLESFERKTSEPNEDEEDGYKSSIWRRLGLLIFGVFAFVFFLLMKLPEARIQNLVIAHLRIMAQEQGMLFSAEKVRIGMITGPAVKIYNAELKSIDDERQTLKIPFLKIRPHLLSLLFKTKSLGVSTDVLSGTISGSIGMSPTGFEIDLDLDSLDTNAATLLKKFIPITVNASIDGNVKINFDQEMPQKSDGQIKLKISKLQAPAQSYLGFNLPKLNVNQSKIEITIGQGQFVIREFQVGQDLKSDDIVAKITGDGTLERVIDRSKLNAKAVFQISSGVFQSFPLLDALLAPAKTSDGKYAYRLIGPFSALEAQPGG